MTKRILRAGVWNAALRHLWWRTRRLMLAALMLCFMATPAAAQQILRDAETEAMFADMAAPLAKAAGLDPRNLKIYLIQDKSINAFVAGGQIIYLHTGLIAAADDANQIEGVIAHELGHIDGGHVIRMNDGVRTATGITILSVLLGAAAMAAGGGEAGAGIMAAGQQVAMGKFLAFTRTQESSADLAGARYLSAAGISGRGSIAFFKKLRNQEYRYAIPQTDSYDRTHPLSGERIQMLQSLYEADPAWQKPTDPALAARFARVKAKLHGFVDRPEVTLRAYPLSNTTVPARYARAYAWHKRAYPQKALDEVRALVNTAPTDPYFLELEGQVLLESGRPLEALPPLRQAVEYSRSAPLIATTLGHALIATEDPARLGEAITVLRNAVQRDNENPFAWYQLGVAYQATGDEPRAALATAERLLMLGDFEIALRHAEHAMTGLAENSADWLRAQDIAMVARSEVENPRNKRRR